MPSLATIHIYPLKSCAPLTLDAAIVEARTPYLEAAFDVVRTDYGSPEAFAEKALGLDAKARDRLKADLLVG